MKPILGKTKNKFIKQVNKYYAYLIIRISITKLKFLLKKLVKQSFRYSK
jgi:hypothetical protein